MEQARSICSQNNVLKFQASEKQLEYFKESIYDIITPGGNSYRRHLELIAFNILTGNMLVKEKISYDGTKYEKFYILSKEGKSEKYSIL